MQQVSYKQPYDSNALDTTMQNLQQEVAQRDRQIEALNNDLQELSSNYLDEADAYDRQIRQKNAQIDVLENEVESLKREIERLQQ